MNAIKIPVPTVNSGHDKVPSVDTTLLCQRTLESADDLEEVNFQYELSPMPSALFTEQGIRRMSKFTLYRMFNTISTLMRHLDDVVFIVDGDFLHQRVEWPSHIQDLTYDEVYDAYISYIKRCYHIDTTVIVFDGYSNIKSSTKYGERLRRSRLLQNTAHIFFQCYTKVVVSQEEFLSIEQNKWRFISQLSGKLTENGISVKQATDDADLLIIQTAIHVCLNVPTITTVVIVGEDVDLLVLMIALTPVDRNMIFLKPGGRNMPTKQYSSSDLQASLSSLKDYILYIHTHCKWLWYSAFLRQTRKA